MADENNNHLWTPAGLTFMENPHLLDAYYVSRCDAMLTQICVEAMEDACSKFHDFHGVLNRMTDYEKETIETNHSFKSRIIFLMNIPVVCERLEHYLRTRVCANQRPHLQRFHSLTLEENMKHHLTCSEGVFKDLLRRAVWDFIF